MVDLIILMKHNSVPYNCEFAQLLCNQEKSERFYHWFINQMSENQDIWRLILDDRDETR